MPKEVKEWEFNPEEILSSKRKVKGIFHKAVIDKDNEFITPDAIKKSIPDFMHLPALHDFHKERPVGLATRIWQEKDGSFGFEGVIKSTEDCDDIWEKISKGNYDHVSIFGRRTEGNQNCSLPQGLRTGPCITNGVRLDSISVCDDNARNDSTSLSVAKAQLIWDGMDMIRKAEVAESSNLMHTVTDYPEKKCAPCKKDVEKGFSQTSHNLGLGESERTKKTEKRYKVLGPGKGNKIRVHAEPITPSEHRSDHRSQRIVEKGDAIEESRTLSVHSKKYKEIDHEKSKPGKDGTVYKKGDDMDDVEKGKGWDQKEKNEAFDKLEREDPGRAADYRQHEKGNEKGKRQYFKKTKKGEEDDEMTDEEAPQELEKGRPVITEEPADRGSSGQKSDASIREPGDAGYKGTGQRTTKDSSGRSGTMRKSEKEQEIDTETRGKDAKEEPDEDDDDEEVEKGIQKIPLKKQPEKKPVNSTKIREVKKGDTMEEKEVSQEYVTKAMVPIEEVDTIIKARTEEISKAYTAQFDEIKKANLAAIEEVKKAYDTKLSELTSRIDKMSEETIRKGGSIVVIPQLLDPQNQGMMSNADALAKITAGK